MKMFDYSELIRVIGNVEMREEREKMMALLSLKEKCEKLEQSLVESGIFDDWNRLKQLCAKAKVRLCVSNQGSNSMGIRLGMNDYGYGHEYRDEGYFSKTMSSGSHWIDYYGFTYESGRGLVWTTHHMTSSRMFVGFKDGQEEKKWYTRIQLLETFRDTYEDYRNLQLQNIEDKFATRIKATDIIR